MRRLLPAPEPPTIAIGTRSCRLDRTAPDFTEAERPVRVTIASATAADRSGAGGTADVIEARATTSTSAEP